MRAGQPFYGSIHGGSQTTVSASERLERLRRLRRMARLMDSAFKIPGTNFRVGVDSLAGLIPGVGDVVTAGVSLYLIKEAAALGASKAVLGRMVANVVIDAAAGSIPVVGDLFDAAYKANLRNLDLLERHLQS